MKIHKERIDSIKVQRSMLEKFGFVLPKPEMNEVRINRLVNMGEWGVRIEEVALDLEKKYESLYISLYQQLDKLQVSILETLNEARKDLFSSLDNQKTQNLLNLRSLENRLHEVVYLASLPGKKFVKNQVSVCAFKQFFTFSKEFKEEFLDLIASKLSPLSSLKTLHSQVTKFISQQLSQTLTAPRAFPTELFRHIEQNEGETTSFGTRTTGQSVETMMEFPNEINFGDLKEFLALDFGREVRKKKDHGRAYSLLTWVDNSTMVVAGQKELRLVKLDSESLQDIEDVYPVVLWRDKVPEEHSIQSICVARQQSSTQLVVGCKDSVSELLIADHHYLSD